MFAVFTSLVPRFVSEVFFPHAGDPAVDLKEEGRTSGSEGLARCPELQSTPPYPNTG